MEIFVKIVQLLLSLSILVLLHEMGHFIFARLFKTRVEKFYLFFNPWFSIFKIKRGDTTYGLGWLPLGGYVKISGMIDESMDKEAMQQPPQPYEFRSKPAWQRLLIMLGGVTVNLLLGFVIYWMVLFTWGETKLPNSSLNDGVWVTDSMAYNIGLRNGDKILEVNNREIKYFTDIVPEMLYGGNIKVEREGALKEIKLPQNLVGQLVESRASALLIAPRMPFIVAEVPDSSINAGTGFLPGDRIVSVGHRQLSYFDQFQDLSTALKDTTVEVGFLRNDTLLSALATLDSNGKFQIVPAMLSFTQLKEGGYYTFSVIKYGFFGSLPAGFHMAKDKLTFYVRQMGLIFRPETGAYKGLGGFATIGNMFPGVWDWHSFWTMTAFLSLILAFMNVLPIPALDGGHVLFLLVEMVTGRKPGDKFLEYAQVAGMILLLGLLVVANGNDILRIFF